MADRPNVPDSTFDDLNIARALLNNPRNTGRQASFTRVSTTLQDFDGSIAPDESSDSMITVPAEGRSRRGIHTSNTWTSSSGEVLSEQDEVDDRSAFIEEYDRLAKKHGVRTITMALEAFEPINDDSLYVFGKPGNWFSRKILRRTSSSQSIKAPERQLKHKRSISDLSLRLKAKKDQLKDKDVQELIRVCGASLLYLPAEYAAGSLALPTCLRATAQYLVQHAPTSRGIFRIPGSHSTVQLLYNHYCTHDEDGDVVSGTVRCPTLPEHIRCDVHDVASAFKKMISGLPGGILGSLSLFDAFVSIQTQLHGDPELTRTKQSKVRARLIALAIATLKSQYRRELICAVFGLLCMIGRAAEISKREDDRGRPLPTSDLMGYGPLGIVFGPLLVGDLLELYTMRLANPRGGLVLLPISPPKSRKEKQKKRKSTEEGAAFNTFVDKIKVANGITEMLITHWRDVVRHMKNLRALKTLPSHKILNVMGPEAPFLRPSASDSFALRKPPDWDDMKSPIRRIERSMSPTPTRRASGLGFGQSNDNPAPQQNDILRIRKQRSRPRTKSNQMLSGARSMIALSPTAEEQSKDDYTSLGKSPFDVQHKETDRQVNLSESSKASRKEGSSETPGSSKKLRKERPLQGKELDYVLSLKTRGKDTRRSPSSKLNKSSLAALLSKTSDHAPTIAASWQVVANNSNGQPPMIDDEIIQLPVPTAVTSSRKTKYESAIAQEDHQARLSALKSDPSPSSASNKSFGALETHESHQKPRPSARESSHAWPSPVIRISAASDIPEGTVSGHIRRIAGSEPGQRYTLLAPSRRQVSKSVHVDSKGRSIALSSGSAPRDPLSVVSQEDDLASLAVLAQALADEASEGKSANSEGSKPQDLPKIGPQREELPKQMSPSNDHIHELPSRPDPVQWKPPAPTSIIPQPAPTNSKASKDEIATSQPTGNNKTPTRNMISNSPLKKFCSPGGSVKALAAKFNTPDSRIVFESPTKTSPTKIVGDSQARFDSRKDNLVAPYTTNPPSPKRSQKSAKSETTPKSSRKPLGEVMSSSYATNSSPVKYSTAHRVLNGSVNQSTTPKSAQYSSNDIVTNTIEPDSTKSPRPPPPIEKTACSNLDGSPQSSPMDHSFPSLTSRENHANSAAMQVPVDAMAPSDALEAYRARTTLTQPHRLPGSPHVHFANSNFKIIVDVTGSAESLPKDKAFVRDTPTPSITPPTRSNSVLHTQIRNLHGQLSAKSEELRQLRNQLDARCNLGIGTLSEQLREAKKEIQMWKIRAEISEKQVEMLTKLPARSDSGQTIRNSQLKRHSEQLSSSCTGYGEDSAKVKDRIQRVVHGIDGAASSHEWSSEGTSTDTIIREVRGAVTGSEYSIWVEQTMMALKSAGPHDME